MAVINLVMEAIGTTRSASFTSNSSEVLASTTSAIFDCTVSRDGEFRKEEDFLFAVSGICESWAEKDSVFAVSRDREFRVGEDLLFAGSRDGASWTEEAFLEARARGRR
jgi:hypothetical protein